MKKNRIGIIVNNDHVLAWQHLVIQKLISQDVSELVIINTGKCSNQTDSGNHPGIYAFHERLDKKLFKRNFNYNTKVNSNSFPKTLQVFDFNSNGLDLLKDDSQCIANYLQKYELDLILNFGELDCEEKFILSARKGIVSYRLDGENKTNPYPPCYWEMINKFPQIGATVVLTDRNRETSVLLQVDLSTYPNSIYVNRDRIYKLAVLIIPRLIKSLNTTGELFSGKSPDLRVQETKNQQPENQSFGIPDSFTAIKNIGQLFLRYLSRNLFYKELGLWSVFYKLKPSNDLLDLRLDSYSLLKYRDGTFIADPFVVSKGENIYIFVEEFDYKKAKGHISLTSINGAGIQGPIQTIIENPYHMSYPFIFEVNGIHYLMPETSSNNTIQLYRCVEFPAKWEFQQNLMENINAKDSTLFYFEQKWWLFTSINETGFKEIAYNELFLFYSDDLFSGQWKSHPLNPIVTDAGFSRSAGKIFRKDGKIYRPSQDCKGNYGNAINFSQITVLNESDYQEVIISKVRPDWDVKLKGLHTFNFENDVAVIDVFQDRKKI